MKSLNLIEKLRNLLYIFQLEEYNIGRFLNWIKYHKVWLGLEKKKKLIWTTKTKLIFLLALSFWIISLLLLAFLFFSKFNLIFAIPLTLVVLFIYFRFIYIFLVITALVIKPLEQLIKKKIVWQAKQKLKKFPNLKVIGISGSFGKTSTKEFLYQMLSSKFKVLKTPGNINTTLGIAYLILTDLSPEIEIFIVEMGAYKRGDIKEICQLVKPQIGILTALNETHLERFKSMENIIKTEFELIESLPQDGLAIINNDNKHCQKNYKRFLKSRVCFYSVEGEAVSGLRARDIQASKEGISFEIIFKEGGSLKVFSTLLGRHNAENLLRAIAAAKECKMSLEEIKKSLENIKAAPHRLFMTKKANGITIIDDTYNGNPDGVKAAIEVLSKFKDQRKIYVTPGLVELGERTKEIHIEIGRNLAQVVNLVILIKNSTTPFLLEGLKQLNFLEEKILIFPDAFEMQKNLPSILESGDVILFQNDWPDNYF